MGILAYFFKSKTQKIKDLLNRDALILDVRTMQEWNEGHITNAMHIPLADVKNNIDKIKSINKPVVAYCKSGVRSARAAQLLKTYNIEALNGGGMVNLNQIID